MKRKTSTSAALASAGALLLGFSAESQASLTSSFQFNGKGNWSIDAVGSNNTPVGNVTAEVPAGSTVVKAFLYSSLWAFDAGAFPTPTVGFDGTVLNPGDFTSLGNYQPNPANFPNFRLGAYRADVTAQVAAKVGGGGGSFNFEVNSENPTGNIDGEVLAIVYSNPGETERTIAFLDGFSSSAADTTSINFANPLTLAQLSDPGFQALLSLGIGFSAGGSQNSTVDIDVAGNRLTSSAGGFDDGSGGNGGLITAGGVGDDAANPVDPFSTSSPDDELYTLNGFLAPGMTGFDVLTRNPSLDDNIFFAGLNVTAVAGINQPPPGVPDAGSTAGLLGLAFAGIAAFRRRFSV